MKNLLITVFYASILVYLFIGMSTAIKTLLVVHSVIGKRSDKSFVVHSKSSDKWYELNVIEPGKDGKNSRIISLKKSEWEKISIGQHIVASVSTSDKHRAYIKELDNFYERALLSLVPKGIIFLIISIGIGLNLFYRQKSGSFPNNS